MKPLYTVAQLRAIEQSAAAALEPGALMQRAGHAAAKVALALLAGPGRSRAPPSSSRAASAPARPARRINAPGSRLSAAAASVARICATL